MSIMQLIRTIVTTLIAALAVIALSGNALADGGPAASDWSKLSASKQTRLGLYMTAEQAYSYTMGNMDKTLFRPCSSTPAHRRNLIISVPPR